MTVEIQSAIPSSGEAAKAVLRSMMPSETDRAPVPKFVVQEAEQQPQEPPPVRWPRVFPSL
jgi:hypothetical protein